MKDEIEILRLLAEREKLKLEIKHINMQLEMWLKIKITVMTLLARLFLKDGQDHEIELAKNILHYCNKIIDRHKTESKS